MITSRDGAEKEQSSRGLCAILQAMPDLFPHDFPKFLLMVASW